MSFMAFDLLKLDGAAHDARTLDRSAQAPRRRLRYPTLERVRLVPVTADATLYETWIDWGGEGIVLKELGSVYRRASARRPGPRSSLADARGRGHDDYPG